VPSKSKDRLGGLGELGGVGEEVGKTNRIDVCLAPSHLEVRVKSLDGAEPLAP